MTSVPPEPPAGSEPSPTPPTPPPAPPPTPQQWSEPPPARPAQRGPGGFNPATVNPMDWGILAAGLLAFIFSFIDYYTYSAQGVSVSENAWHGFFGWFAMLLAVLSAGLLAVHIFAPTAALQLPVRPTVLGGFVLAALFVIIAGFVDSRSIPKGFGIESSRSAGYYVSLIVILVGGVLAFLRLRQTGGKLPWEQNNA